MEKSEQSFCGTELKNGFEKKQTFYNILKAFSSDTPQSIKRQNKGPKEHDENIYPKVSYAKNRFKDSTSNCLII